MPKEEEELSELGKRLIEERKTLGFRFELQQGKTPVSREGFLKQAITDMETAAKKEGMNVSKEKLKEAAVGKLDQFYKKLEDQTMPAVESSDAYFNRVGKIQYHRHGGSGRPGLDALIKPSHFDFDALKAELERRVGFDKAKMKDEAGIGRYYSRKGLLTLPGITKPIGVRQYYLPEETRRKQAKGETFGFIDLSGGIDFASLTRDVGGWTQMFLHEHGHTEPLVRLIFQKRFVPAERDKK